MNTNSAAQITTPYCSATPGADHTICPSSVECYHFTMPEQTNISDVDGFVLIARRNLGGWKPAELRALADDLDAKRGEIYDAISGIPGLLDGLAERKRAEADDCELAGIEANDELLRRRDALPPFTGYVA